MGSRNRAGAALVVLTVLSVVCPAFFFTTADGEDVLVRITKPAKLTVNLEVSPWIAEAPAAIQITGSISDGVPPYTYTLKFGDGGMQEGTTNTGSISTSHEYSSPGRYVISLAARDMRRREGMMSSAVPGVSDVAAAPEEEVKAKERRREAWEGKTAKRADRRRRTAEPAKEKKAEVRFTEEAAAPEEAEEEEPPVAAAPEEAEEEEPPVAAAPEEAEEEEPPVAAAPEEAKEEEPAVAAAPDEAREEEPAVAAAPEEAREEEPAVAAAPEEAREEEAGKGAPAQSADTKATDAFALSLEERIVALVTRPEGEEPGRPAGSVVGTSASSARFRRPAPTLKSGLWPKTWELDFGYEPPGRIIVKSDWRGDAGKPYWYMIYRVANSGENPVNLSLDVEMRTNRGVRSEIYSPRALDAIRAKEKRKLLSFMDMSEELEPGATMEAVALFSNVSEQVTHYDFAVSGLNNTYRVRAGKPGEMPEDKRKPGMFRRILVISYERPGDEFEVDYDKIKYKDAVWIEEKFSER